MIKKFRAYYKPDLDTPDGALKFVQKEINHDLFFIYDEDIWYPFQIPFMDDDWVVQQYLGYQDDNGDDVYEGDIVRMVLYQMFVDICNPKDAVVIDEVIFENGHIHPDGNGTVEYIVIGNIMENPELVDKYNL